MSESSRVNRERYRRGAPTVTELKYHCVWKTKYNYPVLRGDIGLRWREVLRMICVEQGMSIVQGNLRPNHVHLLVSAPTHLSPAKRAQYLKGKSSYRLQREFRELQKRYWGQHLGGRGYFCVTVGAVTEEQVKQYIEQQDDEDTGTVQVWDEAKPSDPKS